MDTQTIFIDTETISQKDEKATDVLNETQDGIILEKDTANDNSHTKMYTKAVLREGEKNMGSSLDAFKENARQFNLAIEAAKEKKASIVEYTDMTGAVFKRYWNGAAFVDRASALYEKDRTGVYTASYNPFIDESLSEILRLRLFLDLDGTAATFQKVDTLETLYEKGYFLNLEPNQNVVDAIRIIIREHPEIEVYVMSSVLSDSKYALQEKNQWIDRYLPEIDMEHRIFPACGENKLDYIPGGVRETDLLLDDYTHNLTLWEPPARGIKLLNGINHTRETWRGNRIRYDKSPEELVENIVDIAINGVIIRDIKPQESELERVLSRLEKLPKELADINKELEKSLDKDFIPFRSGEPGYINPLVDKYKNGQKVFFEPSNNGPKL